ncbi:MAG: hypothetical protein ACXWMO_11195 [Syntrophales bacterium]
MIEDLPEIPPALFLLLQELAQSGSWKDMRLRVKGMLRDLRDQSEVFEEQNIERNSDSKQSLRFEVHLHGALDLLNERGCRSPDCRFQVADRIARSVGLIADRIWLNDTLSGRFVDFGRVTNIKLDEVILDTLVLSRLLPLIQAGIVRFRSPWISACSSCAAQFHSRINDSARDIAHVFRRDLKLKRESPDRFILDTGKCFEPSMIMHLSSSAETLAKQNASAFTEKWLVDELYSAFWTAREASLTGGSIFTNSRIGIAGLLQQEGRLVDRRTLLLLDKEREFSMPWVSELDALQILQLREEASTALPLFREKMAQAMSVSNVGMLSSTSPSEVVAELREQATEVRSELEAKRKNSSRYWKTTYGLLGLGLSAYGVAADQLVPGVGGLLSVIHLLITHNTGYETDVSKLTTRPGFMLMKAQDILSHAH